MERIASGFGRYLPIAEANNLIRTALLNVPFTQDVQVAGIGTTKTGYVIRFKDTASAEAARENNEWLRELGNETELVKPRFGAVVHHVPTEDWTSSETKKELFKRSWKRTTSRNGGFRIEYIGSYARLPLAEALKTMSLERLQELEMIDPTPLPPWRTEAFSAIEIEPDRETAIEQAKAAGSKSDVILYSDASGHNGHLGAAAIGFNKNSPEATESLQIQVGPMDRWAVHAAEPLGVLQAITLINNIALKHRRSMDTRVKSATTLSDSMSDLQAIQNPGNKSGQQIIHTILRAVTNTKTHGIAVRLQWVPVLYISRICTYIVSHFLKTNLEPR
ncbi:Pc13g01280 [Penicillium rubens Wisconsin 54-1255]|jgi:hypothetical protein|uniref:Pc13g01280 protein n=1 Tax=Penicillium rubens (strain ATCC 28089 / DSM 1075 / NRRL 1951 / Wisconsin 54-1255) TaxID=500485 RepID=B6H1P0_PENRW|nr:Pc13g01280 [Penicillium rubens Wisconsin 54-1255]